MTNSQDRTDAAPPVPPEREPGDPVEDRDDTSVEPKDAQAEGEEDRVDAAPREVP